MTSQTSSALFFGFSTAASGILRSFSPTKYSPKSFSGLWPLRRQDKREGYYFRPRCNATYKPPTKGATLEFHGGLTAIKWNGIEEDDIDQEEALKVSTSNEIKEMVNSIRSMLGSMEDGEITVSAYDTAWVALVEDVNGSGTPQFPSSLQWIADHQLPDGSWGDNLIFSAHDRIINTLACVIALKRWNVHPDKCQKGMSFVNENINKLENEKAEHMPIGFEVAFPSLVEVAQAIDIEVPTGSPVLQEIYTRRNLKLTRIPKDIMHVVPTTLLHSLEGMAVTGLDWEKLLKLQCPDGSFLFSPSSTAFALIHTHDPNCLSYLNKAVQRFNGGVPNVYPVDLFEHIWVVDRLQRLGISRYFQSEIKDCVNYVYRYWTEHGICWARNTRVHDIDDTAMGFRLLRLHGHQVSADVFGHFKSGEEFFCFAGQSTQAVTGMFNLYRASQLMFPDEKILEVAKNFSSKFLIEKQASKQLLDKWIIIKDLPGEVGYALEVPWYASLPRVEARVYVEQYGGDDDVWIGKTLYRMPYVNNNIYLELAKLDYNNCQTVHQLEWVIIQKWYSECNLGELGVSKKTLLLAYFVAAASIFEPERSRERFAWAKTTILLQIVASYFNQQETSYEQRRTFVKEFKNKFSKQDSINGERWWTESKKTGEDPLMRTLIGGLNQLSLEALMAHGTDIRRHLSLAWERWMLSWMEEGDNARQQRRGEGEGEAEIIVRTINLSCAGHCASEGLLSHPLYRSLTTLTNRVCHQLRLLQKLKVHDKGSYNNNSGSNTTPQIELDMQKLVQMVLQNSPDDINHNIKQTFLTVAKSFYYIAYCNPEVINLHIVKVLFERVV
ncbi:ent-copalyl diphosphate synthase 1 isoform X1 [Malania oleifera]|uniref:ent-copalyl diphosphate synthase 1 isoform X1 n=1 Tax=Malania oleifera TaxID=397392 RepID=UPI0025AE17C4|nr:ent-copalyl diphosphate synthase 1 isoform X1 [Malania oleifera]